jgi:chemotaxis protein histidine kinase CheA
MPHDTPLNREEALRRLLDEFKSEDDRRGFEEPTRIIPAGITLTLRHTPKPAAGAVSSTRDDPPAPDSALDALDALVALEFDAPAADSAAAFVEAAAEAEFDLPEPSARRSAGWSEDLPAFDNPGTADDANAVAPDMPAVPDDDAAERPRGFGPTPEADAMPTAGLFDDPPAGAATDPAMLGDDPPTDWSLEFDETSVSDASEAAMAGGLDDPPRTDAIAGHEDIASAGRSPFEVPLDGTPVPDGASSLEVVAPASGERAGETDAGGPDHAEAGTGDEEGTDGPDGLSSLVAEMLGLLDSELPAIRETVANTMIVAGAPDMEPHIRVEALRRCADDVSRFASAAEAGGFEGVRLVFEHVRANLLALATPDRPVSDVEAQLFEACLGSVAAYLSAPSRASAVDGVVSAAVHDRWPSAIPSDAPALRAALGSICAMDEDEAVPKRADRATADDVSLAVPEDVNPELLDGLLQELPGHTEEFTLAIQRLLSGGTLEDVTAAQRVAHTVKGAGNTVGVRGIAHLTHQLEDILLALSKSHTLPPRALAESLMAAADCLESMSESLLGESEPPADAVDVLQDILDWANRIDREGLSGAERETTQRTAQAPAAAATPAPRQEKSASDRPEASAHGAGATIRLPAAVVDELLRLVGETIIMTGQIRERLDRAEEQTRSMQQQFALLQQLGADLEQFVDLTDFGVGQPAVPTAVAGFDALEMDRYSELHTYGRRMVEAATDASEMGRVLVGQLDGLGDMLAGQERLNGETQEAVMRTRMVPVKSVFARLQRSVRQTCRLTGKQAELHLSGGDTLIDSDVLATMVDALMHLLRNAVDHGIEDAERRVAQGKPELGNVHLNFGREGNNILIRCRDDGAGLDYDAIRAAATARGLLASHDALTEEDLKRFVLQPNFSTRATVTQTSGRGIGLESVHSHVTGMGGSLSLESRVGRGCTVELRLPVSLISSHALLVRIGQYKIAAANRGISQILHPASGELTDIGGRTTFLMERDTYPVYQLGALLGIESDRRAEARQARPLLLVQGAAGLCAVQVDAVLESRDLVVKNFGRHVGKLRGLLGATILGDGGVTPVLDLPELLRAPVIAQDMPHATARGPAATTRLPIALVVDDSLSARRSLAQFMSDAGYEVRTARDGVEAVEILGSVHPDVMLVDLEMPRMNGMELTAYARGVPELAAVPVVMVTSRATEKHRREAETAGVNVYMSKPFSEDKLLDHLRTLVRPR